ncbi:MAG: hypothetical protein V4559_01835 [Pseudomonadota bacterium]
MPRTPLPNGAFSFLFGVFLICMCGLMLQIVETRVMSVIAFYHMAFFAISMAMLGMTAGSLLVYFKPRLFPRECLFDNLAWVSSAFAVAVILSALALATTVVGTGKINTYAMTALIWLKLIGILLPPYVLAGMAISLALTRSAVPVGVVYGTDLLGAASGCLVVLLLLSFADAISLLFGIAAFGALAAFCFQRARRASGGNESVVPISRLGHGRWPMVLSVAFGLLALINAGLQPTSPGSARDGIVLLSSKGKLELKSPALVRWNTYSRIMVENPVTMAPFLWSASPVTPPSRISQRWLDIDGDAGTSMAKFSGDPKEIDFLQYDITNIAYTIRHQGRSAVIGVGGGRDMMSAYYFGFRDVTGVELNTIFVDLLKRDYRDYNQLLNLPGVKLHVDEARSWFARTDEHFDLIEMSLVDTWASTGAGAYSLSENGLYTQQGWRHFLRALSPTGVFTVSRWYHPNDVAEAGRLLTLAAAALRDQGVDKPADHIFMAGSDHLATLIVGKSAFTPDELAQLRAKVDKLQFKVLVSPDQTDRSGILDQLVAARTPQALSAISKERHLDLSVTTDDRPFFFNQLNPFDPASVRFAMGNRGGVAHGNLLAAATLLMLMFFSLLLVLFIMIFPALPSVRQTDKSLALSGTLYFMLIGVGFMFVEIGLIQRLSTFLGHPVYGLAIGLFGIILATGIGSLVSEYVRLDSTAKIFAWAGLLAVYLVALPLWFPALVMEFEGQSLLVRALMALSAILPSGILMGFGFPAGMRLVNAIDRQPTPWFWAVNGASGVLAASATVMISMAFSINTSLWLGGACYLLIAPIAAHLLSMTQQTDGGLSVAARAEAH